MRILGLVFAGTATARRGDMARFARETLSLERVQLGGVEADIFALPDGSHFAVADPRGMGDTSRSIGFQVADLDEAPPSSERPGSRSMSRRKTTGSATFTFAPDGKLYELVEER